jgi:hypothetical protein
MLMPEDNNQEQGIIMKRIIAATVASMLLGASGLAAADPVICSNMPKQIEI